MGGLGATHTGFGGDFETLASAGSSTTDGVRAGRVTRDGDTDDFSLLTYLLEPGSDRIGALDFQASATDYDPRVGTPP